MRNTQCEKVYLVHTMCVCLCAFEKYVKSVNILYGFGSHSVNLLIQSLSLLLSLELRMAIHSGAFSHALQI